MKTKKILSAALLLILCLLLSGCRVRTGIGRPAVTEGPAEKAADSSGSFSPPEEADSGPDGQEKGGEEGGQTKENPEASRKEYDENRPAEILPGTERTVRESGEGSGTSGSGEDPDRTAAKLSEAAEKTATRTVPAEEADQTGISEDAEEADSAMTYFSVLLRERTGSLLECQRLTVYWETPEDHLTVFKTSPEHSMILEAGAYDVSARLLEANLHVDDGWLGRKDPGVVVKAVSRSVLGTGVVSPAAARSIYAELVSREGWPGLNAVKHSRVLLLSEELLEAPHLRLAAMLMIAGTANPDKFADVDPDEALAMLGEEAAGWAPNGIYWYTEPG